MNERPDVRTNFPAKSSAEPVGDLHGSARWLLEEEAKAAGLYDAGGVVLGETRNGDLLNFHGDGHVLVFAPSGAGKGIGFMQTNLVDYPGSLVVLDPKGENAAVSARHRRDFHKQKIVILDPFGESGKPSGSYNPLAPLSYLAAGEVVGKVRSLAEALIPTRGGKDETHWINGARLFIEALLLFLLVHEPVENRHLIRLHTLAFGSPDQLENLFAALRRGFDPDPETARLCVALGNWWAGREEKERSYFQSIVHQELAWLGNAVWHDVLTGSEVISPKTEAVTVYLVLPWLHLRGNANWLRVMVASLLSQIISAPGRPEVPVLFLLDEAYIGLGRMEIILEAAAILRSEGGRIALIYQDLNQLKSLYPQEWESFLANAGASLFWAVNDMTGARYVSDRCGTKTQPVPGSATGHARQLRQPAEIITAPGDRVVCFLRGLHPARFNRLDVRTNSRYRDRLDPNPKQANAQPAQGSPGQAVARSYTAVDLDAPPTVQSGRRKKPLPPRRVMPASKIQDAKMGAALSEQFGQYVYWDGNKNAFGYLNDKDTFVPVT